MGADIQWHTGTIRFGPKFKSHKNHDKWSGKVSLIADLYDLKLCHLFVIAVADGKLSTRDYRDILRLCDSLGYKRVHQTREEQGRFYKQEMDLTRKPYRWRRITEIEL